MSVSLDQAKSLIDQLSRVDREALIQYLQAGLAVAPTPSRRGAGAAEDSVEAAEPAVTGFTTVSGTANATTNIRSGPRYNATDPSDTDAKVMTLKSGNKALITGFTIYPPAGEFERRYRLELNGQTVWSTANTFDVDSLYGRRGLEFLTAGLQNPAAELLRVAGVTLDTGGVSLSQATEAAALLWDLQLSRITSANMLDEAVDIIKKLENHGVMLGVEANGKWSIGNLRTVFRAVEDTAKGTGALFESMLGSRDNPLAFRVMYAPVMITRSGKDNVNPFGGDALWYARNTAGYEIVFGNRAFFKGQQTTKTNPGLFYTAEDLVAHEIAHIINWRYPREIKPGSVLTQRPSEYYEQKLAKKTYTLDGQQVAFKTYNEGYAMAARSSDGIHETVTDAIACLNLNRFMDDIKGRARKAQMSEYMRQVITYRVREHGGESQLVQDIAGKVSTDPRLPDKMKFILEIMRTAPRNLDQELNDIGTKLAVEPGPTG